MDLLRFNADDIHELRVQMAEKFRSMPEAEAERKFQEEADEARRAIEEIRRANSQKVS
jgi:hypothetical protein